MLTSNANTESALDVACGNDPRWRAVEIIERSATFARSPRMRQMLRYLTEQTLAGRAEDITESELACHVFSRDTDFDPSCDTIVRSHLTRLRARLLEFGQVGGYRITLPKGQYRLEFQRVDLPLADNPPVPLLKPVTVPAATSTTPHIWIVGLMVVVLAVAGFGLHKHYLRAKSAADVLWSSMFMSDRPTMMVAADSSLVMMNALMHHNTSLGDYISGKYMDEIRALEKKGVNTMGIGYRRHTSIVDLEMAHALTTIAVQHKSNFKVRYARDISLEDLKGQNVIISGSIGANPWLELYEPSLNFHILDSPGSPNAVINRSPRPHEEAIYACRSGPGAKSHTYGILAFLPGLGGSSNVLILQGTSVAGTEAISDLVFDSKRLNTLLRPFRRADGSLMHFEMLISTENINGTAGSFQVVASRVHP